MNIIDKIKDLDEHWKIPIKAIFIVVFFGVLPSVFTCDWSWFSRSGSIIVVYGVYIVWLDYKGKIDSDLTLLKSAVNKKFGEKAEELHDIMDTMRSNNRLLYDRVEFILLASGTVIWGYGDLVGKMYC
ncbi:hypothetical protein NJR55_00470 [Idiomarina sp. M1R2S28]|uniref:Uncharacterized protein n=1 Tax=Idiomarina rhizosphaerae TaxID=2961572 RepID=A0A9X2JQ64_9GAMM|nr:hypothetical protein [Idiomarina rhizosphaerae]MCP1338052.1 hypothetical protein [Idiomarina rhizosphaerae]